MTIGRSANRSTNSRRSSAKARRRSDSRKVLLESLELRQLMAVGPQLISIQPNEGGLINEGQVLNVSPNEIIFRFDDSANIDPLSVGNGKGILISRTGGDGVFDRAYVSSDLGTNGAVVLDFASAVPGQTGNGIQVSFTQVARNDSSRPVISVTSVGVNIEVNTTFGLKTTAQDILTAFSNSSAASAKIITTRLRGNAAQVVADTVPVAQPLVLTGANTARASSSLNAGTNVQVEFLAAQAGPQGARSRVVVTQRDFGGRASPVVTVTNDTVAGVVFQTVNVQMNSNPQFMTRLGEFVSAINSTPAAANIIQARIISGLSTTAIGAAAINYSPIVLQASGDTYITPGYIGVGETGREVVMRFAEPLPDDAYRIDILGRGSIALRNTSGQPYNMGSDTSLGFVLNLGARIDSIVPQPITRNANGTLTQATDTIHVYFNRDELNAADAENEAFYQLRYTHSSVSSSDDLVVYPRQAIYNAQAGRVELRFARDLNQFFNDAGGRGSFRLRIGSKEGSEFFPASGTPTSGPGIETMRTLSFNAPIVLPPLASDPGSRFDNAADLRSSWTPSASTPSAVVLASEIKNTTPYNIDFPGADTEPGNRKIRYQDHVTRVDEDGIEVIEYNFQGLLGTANGSNQLNAITEDQKVLVRRIVSLYENYLGVRFVETTSRGFTVAVGDLRAIDPTTVNGPGFPFLVTDRLLSNGQPATIVDIQDFNSADQNRFGSELFRTFMRGIGNLLGLGFADEIPGLTVQSNVQPINPGIDTELVFPGNADIVYGQHAHRPESKDIDLYRFSLPTTGKVKIEVSAERLVNSSLLDSALRLYQRTGTTWTEISGNDDYFSQDSFLSLDLSAGDYIVGVSAKGNQAYDPNIEDSGLGGRSEGRYELRIDFRPPEPSLMRDRTGLIIDGDLDGRSGGVYDFWFMPSSSSSTIFVDKAAPGTGDGAGTLASPYRKISSALAAAAATPSLNRVIRIVGNGGADGLLQTTSDNLAYEIGFNRLSQAQADGTTFDVPKNTTVMVDAGAIIKVTRARIGVGSTTISVDRSGGALQVLGIPRLIDTTGRVIVDSNNAPVPGSVYFTSINDRIGIGQNRDTNPPAAAPGDWGGIDIRNRVDAGLSLTTRPGTDRELQGLFLNSIVHGDIRFGGGQVVVDGVSQVITPIHLVDSRPSVVNNLITRSADAGIAATPNSFKESNFQDPITQIVGRFISDFDRVGPFVRGNRLLTNTINGLFVKTRTGAASTTEVMTVPGRFDDLDIVHVLTENLIVQGSAGGAVAKINPPESTSLGLEALNLTGLTNGLVTGTYRYKFAFVDSTGQRSPASAPTRSIRVVNLVNGVNDSQVRLTSLPTLQPGQRLAIYRANVVNGLDEDYRLIATVGESTLVYIDQNAAPGAALTTTPNLALATPSLAPTYTPSAIVGLTTGIPAGTYRYQYRTVGQDGSESSFSLASNDVTVFTSPGINNGRVDLANLPNLDLGNRLRIYRSPVVAGVASGFSMVGEVGFGTRTFVDTNTPVRLTPPSVPAQASDVAPPNLVPPIGTAPVFTPSNAVGSQLPSGQYFYRFAFAAADGSESTASTALLGGLPITIGVPPGQNQVAITNLPTIPADRTLRVYRAVVTPVQPQFELVGIVASGGPSFTDTNLPLTLLAQPATDATLPVPSIGVSLAVSQSPTLSNSISAGTYVYRFSFVSAVGESPAATSSQVTVTTTAGVANGQVLIGNLPTIPPGQSLRIYRATVQGGTVGDFFLLNQVAAGTTSYLDIAATPGEILDDTLTGELNARTDGSLVIDAGAILKLQGSRIEVQDGGQLVAEGTVGRQVIMTSIDDFTYGAGGTFNTPNRPVDSTTGLPNRSPAPGNWGGLYIGQGSTGSLDYSRVVYAGGTTRIDGGFAGFNPIEAHQADLRIANSTFENNADGVEGATTADRVGRGTNFGGTIFVRGAQPIIIDNRLSNNRGAAINIDVNSLNSEYNDDYGRSTGRLGRTASRPDNQGPLIEGNRIGNRTGVPAINGLQIRGQTLTTESVWDDADIVHVVSDEIVAENQYTYGGLRLESKTSTSLIVKFGGGTAASTGLTASGRSLDIADRIGGSVQIIGQPGFPVIMTALTDDSVGAGFEPDGTPNFDTNNDGDRQDQVVSLLPTGPEVDRGILIDNDVPVNVTGHFEYQPQAGGGSSFAQGSSGVTAQGRTQQLVNANLIFSYENYIDVGRDGGAFTLASTTITLPPTLVSPDLVASEGNFVGNNGATVNWRVESRFDNGVATLFNRLSFTSDTALGNIRFINYLDEDVLGASDDLLFTRGTPGQADFRIFTVDGGERIGFSQGGAYLPGSDLVNATYVGWAADDFPLLDAIIQGAGTQYTLAGNIVAANLPAINDPTLGAVFGPNDVTTALAWDLNPNATSSLVTTFLELQPTEVRATSVAGEWRGLLFETESNDRNVAVVNERESARSTALSSNDLPSNSQFLGTISSSFNSGDENARLGFQIHGTINRRADADVYSFYAQGGTEVWLDIDRTSNSLDSVVELIGSDGQILALSDNSFDEELTPNQLFAAGVSANTVNPLRKSSRDVYPTSNRPLNVNDPTGLRQPRDLYSTNSKDAGMRLVLPGPTNQTTLYHVRVRSSNSVNQDDATRKATLSNPALVDQGKSQGSYQLQIRLSEADEFPGSTVSYADIRFATNAIDLAGVPRHSPLLGEAAEIPETTDTTVTPPVTVDTNGSFATAQELGNLLATDRSTLSLAGSLSSSTDVDWYTFTLDYQVLNTQLAEYFATVFDIDYADGVGRPDTSLYLYNSAGQLLSFGLSSNILDDRAGALRGADNTDLGRGSAGVLDPFIGSTELRTLQTNNAGTVINDGRYFLAVTSQAMIPNSLLIYNNPNAANPLIRAQPLNSTQWIVEDRVERVPSSTPSAPIVPNFLPVDAAVPFTLSDVGLFLSRDDGNSSTILIADPKTGVVTNFVGTSTEDFQDIAFRFNGDLRGFNGFGSAGPGDPDNSILYYDIDTANAAASAIGQSNIQTSVITTGPGPTFFDTITDANAGIQFNALSIVNAGQELGIAVGNRGPGSLRGIQPTRDPATAGTNVIYEFNTTTGEAVRGGSNFLVQNQGANDVILGNGTDIQERGYIETNPDPGAVSRQLILSEATQVTGFTTTNLVSDGAFFTIRTAGGNATFEMNAGPQLILNLNPDIGPYFLDGDTFTLDGQVYEIQTNSTPVAPGSIAVNYQNSFTNQDFFNELLLRVPGVSTTPPTVTISLDGNRINFSGAIQLTTNASFARVATVLGNGTVGPGRVSIPFLAADTAAELATKVSNAINALGLGTLSATAAGRNVNILGGDIIVDSPGVRRTGLAPGGTITGITAFPAGNALAGQVFAVSDNGGLFRVNNNFIATETTQQVGQYITTSTDLTGLRFSGLTVGPQNVEGGRYANLLFATTIGGDIVAFDTNGTLQPVFANGASRISTGQGGLTGLAFSTFDYNLWHTTPTRALDAGHGRLATPDGVVGALPGGLSWYFGFQNAVLNGVNSTGPVGNARFGGAGLVNTYNVPGGAKGVLESEVISLADVAPSDLPQFYFTYHSTVSLAQNQDVLQVRVQGDNGVWQTVAVNDVVQGGNLFNNTATVNTWRQARIDLSPFAGNNQLRFRFEFSTGAGLGASGGPELRALAGNQLVDGQTFVLSNRTFELDFGSSIVVPTGDRITNGTSFQVGGTVFSFFNGIGTAPTGVIIPYSATQSSLQIANAVANAVNLALLPDSFGGVVQAIQANNEVQITGGVAVTVTGNLTLQGNNGVRAGRFAVPVARSMNADQVALAIRNALRLNLAGNADVYPVNGDTITLTGLTVNNPGPFTATNSAPMANARGSDNDFEGIYLDDFIIGFAERGEIVIDPNVGPTVDTTFVPNPNSIPGSINVGPYQLEIRGGEEYLTPTSGSGVYTQSFAINERLSTGATLTMVGSENLVDGDFIDINDGVRSLRFVFKSTLSSTPLGPNEVAVTFTSNVRDAVTGANRPESASTIASRLRDVINSPSVQSRLAVTAISINGAATGLGGPSVALSPNAIVTLGNVSPRQPIATVLVNKRRGDVNTPRDQGQIVIENSRISDSSNFAIRLRADDRTPGSNNPNPGAPRNTVVLNNARLAPGAVIINNELISNLAGGIQIVGDVAPAGSSVASVPFARIINNTILGGTTSQSTDFSQGVFQDILFNFGTLSFADQVPTGGYQPSLQGGAVPVAGFNQTVDALGIPNFSGTAGIEPGANQGAISLGNGGRLIVEFTDNILTGSDSNRPDLVVFEVGESESVAVDVSPDGVTYTSVGFIDGFNKTIDLDQYGFNSRSRLRFVRLTDVLNNGAVVGDNVGADIDAVGAISSVLATRYQSGGVGIEVGENASPTLLNNVLVNNATALSIAASSQTTVVGGTLYQRNAANLGGSALIGQSPLTPANSVDLFVDVHARRLYPELQAPTIDSTIDSLLDRAGLVSVKAPLGLQVSPILAPTYDLNGLLRIDDPTVDSPFGLGENVFKDRGAQDRSDFIGPATVVLNPLDNDTVPADVNPTTGVVELKGTNLPFFDIRLFDGGDIGLGSEGTGVDPSTVSAASIILTRDGKTLVEGVDYRFGFNSSNSVIRLTPLSGVWPSDSVYSIRFISPGQSVIPLSSVANSTDGTTYEIIDSSGIRAVFELDLGAILTIPVTTVNSQNIQDGGQFTLTQNGVTVLFEFDSNGLFTTNAIVIPLVSSDTPAVVISKMIAAIQGAGLSVSANQLSNNRLQIIGEGLVVNNLSNMTVSGSNGVVPGAIRIPLNAAILLSAADVASAVATAIRNAGIAGVSVSSIGSNVLVEGARGVAGLGASIVDTIKDRAGNPLRANQPDGSTVLTIQIGEGFDYGDAPDGPYASKKSSNGARHAIVDGFQLGSSVSSDPDARLTDADTDDGLALSGSIVQGFSSQFIVTASGASTNGLGYLSAWVDFDGDGLFEDEERITNTANDLLNDQTKPISFTVPGTAKTGMTYARLRYSSTRNLSPTGEAIDGEVEDHVITIGANPYKNQTNNADVNADGFVTPIDALQVINFLARNGSSAALTNPPNRPVPPYVDVNGDGFVTPIDVLIVINTINRQTFGAGEGEASDGSNSWISAASASSQAAPLVTVAQTSQGAEALPQSPVVRVVEQAWGTIAAEGEFDSAWMEDEEFTSMSQDSVGANAKVGTLYDDVFAEFEKGGLD